ncbi:MAG TPA: MaoC/PaaZ C-terminal domain-containing protein [Acidimicrobiales bacterium]|nr:MaoC/PaaZ C-terminal domain-containing protein [Acidimicrobiales bacterium]
MSDTILGLGPGDEIPTFVRSPGLHHWNRYAAVNDEFVPIHMDDEAGRAAGYPSAFGMGNLQWSYLHNALRQWMGDDGRIERMHCQFRAANVKGQTVTAHGRVTEVRADGDRLVAELEMWTENQDGQRLAPGGATVSVPAG